MLADGCESSISPPPAVQGGHEETINFIFDSVCGTASLTSAADPGIFKLRDTFANALLGMFHTRITYPGTPKRRTAELPAGGTQWLERDAEEEAEPAPAPPPRDPAHDARMETVAGSLRKRQAAVASIRWPSGYRVAAHAASGPITSVAPRSGKDGE